MMKKMKSLAAVLTVLCMCAAYMPVTEQALPERVQISVNAADSGTCGENLTWTIDGEGTLTISGTGAMQDFEDKTLMPWYNQAVKAVIIEDGVTSIGEQAFSTRSMLTFVVIPETVTSIGKQAFRSCINLTEISIPDSVTEIGAEAFAGCSRLNKIKLSNSLTAVQSGTFMGCYDLIAIDIPESVKVIANDALAICSELAYVTIRNRECVIEEEGDYLYPIPNGATIYGYPDSTAQAYAQEYHQTFVDVNKNSGTIGDNLEWNFEPEGTLTISGTGEMPDWENYTLQPWHNRNIRSVIIEEGITHIGDWAFGTHQLLASVSIPDTVTSIGVSAFQNCRDMTEIDIPNSVTSIEESAFAGSGLTSIEFPENLTEIKGGVFSNCHGLTSVTIPERITSIGTMAFHLCSSLTSVVIENPNCNIDKNLYDDEGWAFTVIPETAVIYGYLDSTAQAYAEEYHRPFIALDQELPKGDANADGKVDIMDVITINRAVLGKEVLADNQLKAIDFNGNGSADAEESLMIMKYLVGLITELA